jgi:hypothetical protein
LWERDQPVRIEDEEDSVTLVGVAGVAIGGVRKRTGWSDFNLRVIVHFRKTKTWHNMMLTIDLTVYKT